MLLSVLAFDSFADKALLVEPSVLKMRHAQDVQFSVNNWKEGMQLSIAPGGVYIQSEMPMDGAQLIQSGKGLTWLSLSDHIAAYGSEGVALQPIERVLLGKEFQHLSLSKNIIIAANKKKLHFFQLDEGLNAKPWFTTQLGSNIVGVSLSESYACVLLENRQLARIDLLTQKNLLSVRQNKSLQSVITVKDACITTTQKKQIALWQVSNNALNKVSVYRSTGFISEILLNESHVILANGNTGVTLLEVKNNVLRWVGSYNKLGNVIHVASGGGQLFTGDDRGVISLFDISQPETPLLISDFHLHAAIKNLSFDNNFVYAQLNDRLVKIDFSANSSPIISTQGVNQGGSRRSFIRDNILYVADWFSGMHLYDISLPRAPRLLSSYPTPGSPKGVLVHNGTAFVADDDHGLQIVDVSDPYHPAYITDLPLSGLTYTMKLEDDLLYLAAHRGGFHIIDVSDVSQPKLLSTYDTPSKAWALEIQEGLLYVADDSSGLMIFDVTNPAAPLLINQFNPGGFAEDVILIGDKAYVAFFDLGLMILDISDPLDVKPLALLDTPGNARGIEIKGELLYLASWEAGIHIIDITDSEAPTIIGHYDTNGAIWGLSVKDHALFVMDWWGGVKVLDVREPAQPMSLGEYQTAGKIKDILYQNDFIYTAHGSRGLQVYDANNSLNPVWATGLDFDGDARSVVLNGKLALVAAGDGGLVIVDVSNPFQINWLAQLVLPSSADLVQSFDDVVFVATKKGDWYEVDISEPKQPRLTARHRSVTQAIFLSNKALFHLDARGKLYRYSANNMTKTGWGKPIDVGIGVTRLAVNGQDIFVGMNDGQVRRYRFDQKTWQHIAAFQLPESLLELHVYENKLYVTSKRNKLYVYDIVDESDVQLRYIYPTTHEIERLSFSKDAVFFSGERRIASGKLLPEVIISQKNNKYVAKIPNNMPLGAYNVSITDRFGQQLTISNAFQIAFPKFKSKFTMADLKKKMAEKNLPGKLNSPP